MRTPIRFKRRSLSFDLTATGIDSTSAWVVENLQEAGVAKPDYVRARLLFEEALLNLADHFGREQKANVVLERRYRRLRLRLIVEGEKFNPSSTEGNDPQDEWETSLFAVLGMRIHYSYSSHTNVLRISLPQPSLNPVLKLAMAILVGIAVGIAGNLTVPVFTEMSISDAILQPIADMWVRLLQAISGPIIFLTALTATLGTKRLADFGGSRLFAIARYFVFILLAIIITMLCALPLLPLDVSTTEASSQLFADTLDGILQIVPGNLLEPFIAANTPQLLLIAIATGYLLGAVDSRVSELKTLIQQLNVLGLTVAQQACNLVPVFVGLLLCLKIWTHQTDMLGTIWMPLLISMGISIGLILLVVLLTSARMRMSPILLISKIKGPFIEAVKQGTLDYSSVDRLAYSCRDLLGIDSKFAQVTLPQGLVLYMPTSAVGICVFCLFAAETQQIDIDQIWLLSLAAVSVVLAVATPPLTGANLLSFIMAFSYLGISSEVMLDVMIFDIIFGVFCIAFDQAALQLDVIWQAKYIGFLNEDTLRSRP